MPRYTAGSTTQGVFSVNVTPVSDDGAALGTTSLKWSDLFLASGSVINWNEGDITLTHAANTLTLAGGLLDVATGIRVSGGTVPASGSGLELTLDDPIGTVRAYNRTGSAYLDLALDGLTVLLRANGATAATMSTAEFQMGVDAASPVTQVLKGPDARAGTDTNTVGGRINWEPGLSTGNAVPTIQAMRGGAATVTSGTGAQTLVDRFIPNAFKVLTDGSAIAVLNVTVANNTMTGGKIVYCIEATDGTDYQSEIGEVFYAAENDGAAVVGAIAEANTQQAISAGGSTLATDWAITNANPAVISVNANTSLTPSTGYPRITFSIQNLGQQAVAIQ